MTNQKDYGGPNLLTQPTSSQCPERSNDFISSIQFTSNSLESNSKYLNYGFHASDSNKITTLPQKPGMTLSWFSCMGVMIFSLSFHGTLSTLGYLELMWCSLSHYVSSIRETICAAGMRGVFQSNSSNLHSLVTAIRSQKALKTTLYKTYEMDQQMVQGLTIYIGAYITLHTTF